MKPKGCFLFMLFFSFLFYSEGLSQITYEVVIVRGQVAHDGVTLNRGDRIELLDLDEGSNLRDQIKNFSFGSNTDVVHLLDPGRRKIVVVPAQAVRAGRDLMLATRGIKYIRSDFEFQRAFTPGESVIALLSEDTLICRGLQKYRFAGNEVLVAGFEYQGQEFFRIIGRNDTLFLTRNHLFGMDTDHARPWINSFEVGNISLFIDDIESIGHTAPLSEIQPFTLYFLDDMISYFVATRYDGIAMDQVAIYHMLVPNFITERQIQREYNLLTAEEARQWLFEKINTAFHNQ